MWTDERIKLSSFYAFISCQTFGFVNKQWGKKLKFGLLWGLITLCLHNNAQAAEDNDTGTGGGGCSTFCEDARWGQYGKEGVKRREDLLYGKIREKSKGSNDKIEEMERGQSEDDNKEVNPENLHENESHKVIEETVQRLKDVDTIMFDAVYKNLGIEEDLTENQKCERLLKVLTDVLESGNGILRLSNPSNHRYLEGTVKILCFGISGFCSPFNTLFISNDPWPRRIAAALGTVPLSVDFANNYINLLKLYGFFGVCDQAKKLFGNRLNVALCSISFVIGMFYAISDAQSAYLAGRLVGWSPAASTVIASGNFFFTSLAGLLFFKYAIEEFVKDFETVGFLLVDGLKPPSCREEDELNDEGLGIGPRNLKLGCFTLKNPKIEEQEKFEIIGQFYGVLNKNVSEIFNKEELEHCSQIREYALETVSKYINDDINVSGICQYISLIADAKQHYDVDYPFNKSVYKVCFAIGKSTVGHIGCIVIKWALVAYVLSVAMPGNVNVFAGKRLTEGYCDNGLVYVVNGDDPDNANIIANWAVANGGGMGTDEACCEDFVKGLGSDDFPLAAAFGCALIPELTSMVSLTVKELLRIMKSDPGQLSKYLFDNGATNGTVNAIMSNFNTTMSCSVVGGEIEKNCPIVISSFVPKAASFTAQAGGWTQGLALSLISTVTIMYMTKAVTQIPMAYREIRHIQRSELVLYASGMGAMVFCLAFYDWNIYGTLMFGQIMYNLAYFTTGTLASVHPYTALIATIAILTIPFSGGGMSIACMFKSLFEGKTPHQEYVAKRHNEKSAGDVEAEGDANVDAGEEDDVELKQQIELLDKTRNQEYKANGENGYILKDIPFWRRVGRSWKAFCCKCCPWN